MFRSCILHSHRCFAAWAGKTRRYHWRPLGWTSGGAGMASFRITPSFIASSKRLVCRKDAPTFHFFLCQLVLPVSLYELEDGMKVKTRQALAIVTAGWVSGFTAIG